MIKLNSENIIEMIKEDQIFKSIIRAFKTDNTIIYVTTFENKYNNGLTNKIYYVTTNNDKTLLSIIVPIFSSEKTITWNFLYLKDIKSSLPSEFSSIDDHELVKLIKCPLYYIDKYTTGIQYLSFVNVSDWIEHGEKGKNGYSVYFWNNKLPNKYQITKKNINSEIFVKSLEFMSDSEIKTKCLTYAEMFHKRFADITKRSEKTKINNISSGLYAQIKVYLWMMSEGYDVRMDWYSEDDLGIDIQYKINNIWINIDVKSTKDDMLKISKKREETDFYAVCDWDKKEPRLLGFLFKYNFWKSDIIKSTPPEMINNIYYKKISKISEDLITVDKLFNVLNNYKMLKMKKNVRLFNNE